MSEALPEPSFRDDSRLALPLLAAIALHLFVVFGVQRPAQTLTPPRFDAIEVILAPAPAAPETRVDTAAEPPLATLELPPPPPVVAAPPVPAPAPPKPAPPKPAPPKTASPEPAPPKSAPRKTRAAAPPPAAPTAPAAAADSETPPAEPLPSAAQLIARSLAIASSGAGLIEEHSMSGQPESQRTAYVTSRTRDFALIAYKSAWFDKVMKIGNINYPEEARRQGLSGRLQLDVAIRADGSLKSVSIKHSSGFDVLDEAAMHIVELAAPFAPFPPETAARYDVVHMTNWWRFDDGAGFSAQ